MPKQAVTQRIASAPAAEAGRCAREQFMARAPQAITLTHAQIIKAADRIAADRVTNDLVAAGMVAVGSRAAFTRALIAAEMALRTAKWFEWRDMTLILQAHRLTVDQCTAQQAADILECIDTHFCNAVDDLRTQYGVVA